MMVVFYGADGSGKSSVINELYTALSDKFTTIKIYHLRLPITSSNTVKNVNITVTDPHEKPVYTIFLSVMKLFYFLLIYIVGYSLHSQDIKSKNTLIILDRYYHDLLIDPKRFRYGGPLWLAKVIGYFIPRPHLFFLLEAPAEILQERKQEVSKIETKRQGEAYHLLFRNLKNGMIIDATQPLREVAASVEETIRNKVQLL